MFTPIEDYMKLSRDNRRQHLELKNECIEIGGDSREFRGILAHYLKTTIPRGTSVHLCHACHNGNCSNQVHLYWGTPKDNAIDLVESGNHRNGWEKMVSKHGEENAKKIMRKIASVGGRAGGGHNALSEDQINDYRKKIIESNPLTYGWVSRASKIMGITHTQVRRFTKKYMVGFDVYKRKGCKE